MTKLKKSPKFGFSGLIKLILFIVVILSLIYLFDTKLLEQKKDFSEVLGTATVGQLKVTPPNVSIEVKNISNLENITKIASSSQTNPEIGKLEEFFKNKIKSLKIGIINNIYQKILEQIK